MVVSVAASKLETRDLLRTLRLVVASSLTVRGFGVSVMPSSHCTIFKLVGSPLFSHCMTNWGSIQSLLCSNCTMDRRQGVSHCTISQ